MERFIPSRIGSKINIAFVVSNSFIIGIITGWPGVTFPRIIKGEPKFSMSLSELSLTVVSFCAGQLTALVPFAYLDKTVGKRRIAQVGIHFSVAGWLTIILVHQKFGIHVGMFFFGNWATLCLLSLGPYLAEIASPRVRGKILSLMAGFFMIGAIFESALGIYLNYHQISVTNLVLTVVQSLLLLCLSETPYFYLQRGNTKKAEENFEWMRGCEDKQEFDLAVIYVKKQVEMENNFVDIFKNDQSRRALYFAIILSTFQKLTLNVPLSNLSSIVLPAKFMNPSQFPIIFFGISMVFNFISGSIIDKSGRRKLMLISSFGSTVCYIGSAVWFFLVQQLKMNLANYSYVPYFLFGFETAFFSFGVQYIPYIIDSELFGVNIKAKALSLVLFTQIVYNAANTKLFAVCFEQKVSFVMFIAYAINSSVGFWYYTQMYDTKGKTLEEVYEHFERKGRRRTTLMSNLQSALYTIMPRRLPFNKGLKSSSKSSSIQKSDVCMMTAD